MDGNNFQEESNFQKQPQLSEQQNTSVENPVPVNHYQDYTAQVQYQPIPEEPENQNNTLSIVSLVLGILSIVSCCVGAGFMIGIGGIICSVFARKQSKNGMNMGGLICSIIGVVLGVISTIFFVIIYIAAFAAGY